jgi:hypothetical protein
MIAPVEDSFLRQGFFYCLRTLMTGAARGMFTRRIVLTKSPVFSKGVPVMSVLSRKATVDTFSRSAMHDALKEIVARFNAKFDTSVCLPLLAVAFFVPDGCPRLVALAVLSFCSFASILRVCQRE